MSNKPGHESYYSTLTSLSHSDGLSLVVGNPGTGVPSTYFWTTDVLLTDESPGLPTTSRLFQQVTMGRPPAGFAVLSYDVPGLSFSSVNLLSQYASMIYVTSGTAPFPYLSLPGYLSTLLADVQAVSLTTFSISVASATSSGGTLTGMRTMVYYQGGPNGKGVHSALFQGHRGRTLHGLRRELQEPDPQPLGRRSSKPLQGLFRRSSPDSSWSPTTTEGTPGSFVGGEIPRIHPTLEL